MKRLTTSQLAALIRDHSPVEIKSVSAAMAIAYAVLRIAEESDVHLIVAENGDDELTIIRILNGSTQ